MIFFIIEFFGVKIFSEGIYDSILMLCYIYYYPAVIIHCVSRKLKIFLCRLRSLPKAEGFFIL